MPTQQGDQPPGALDFLRNHPQFNQLKMLVQQNPGILQPVLQQLGASNPQILQLINQHQEEFIRLLNEPVNPAALGAAMGGAGGGAGEGGLPPGVVQVTAEENEAIERVRDDRNPSANSFSFFPFPSSYQLIFITIAGCCDGCRSLIGGGGLLGLR